MSRIDDLLERSADEVRQAVAAMPEREVTTVSQTSTRKTYLSAAVAVAGVIVVVLLGWALFGFGGAEEVDPIEPTPTPVDPDAAPLPAAPASLEDRTYATDVLGPTFSFAAGEGAAGTWFLQIAAPGEVAISHPLSDGPGDRDIWFGYPDALSDPENPYTAGWPIDDLDGWLEANADWVVDGPRDTTVGGRTAIAFTLAGAPPCRDPEGLDEVPCPTLAFDDDQGALWLVEGARFEIWWIEDVDGSPFVIAAGDSTWTDEFRADVDAVVASWAAGGAAPGAAPSTVETDADLRWEYDVPGLGVIVLAGDLPDGFPARTWRGENRDDIQGVGAEPGLHRWDTSFEPALPEPVVVVDGIVAGADGPTPDACGALSDFVVSMDPANREAAGSFLRAEAFARHAADQAEILGCIVQPGPQDGEPVYEIVSPDGPSSALDLEGDAELLAERARAAAAETGDPELEAAIEDAIDFGLLDFSGPPEDAIVILLEFSWLLDTTNPEPEMLDLFLDPEGGARTSWETSDTFGADGLIVVTGDGEYEVESAEASALADYSPVIAAASPDDAVLVEVVVSIPEIEVRAADGSLVRTVPERVSQPLAYVLVPGDVGWLIWSELA